MDEDGEMDGTVLAPDERLQLAEQLQRLNTNIERQFEVIERQRAAERAADRKANRWRWAVVMVVVCVIMVGNVRVEMVRHEQRAADKAAARALAQSTIEEQRRACQRTNVARSELRRSFDDTLALVVKISPPEAQAKAEALRQSSARQLGVSLRPLDCAQSTAGGVFASCAAAIAAGAAPLHRGDDGYSAELDGDNDGTACE